MAVRKRPSDSACDARRGAPKRATQSYNGAVRAQLADIQRARIVSAAFEVAAQRGAGNVTVAHMVERSGISRRTFYEQFTDREDCLLAAFEQALAHVSARVAPAFGAQKSWRERIRAGLIELLVFLDEEPLAGRLLIAESLASGPRTLERRGEVLAQVTGIVEEGRTEAKAGSPPPLMAEGIVGGVLSVLHSRLMGAGRTPLITLTNPLMSMIVLPYLGTTAARREVERPAPKIERGSSQPVALLSDPFKEAGMRLTYRTVRVLSAMADNPGASNRAIGEQAGMSDQGQISKLLSRLERIGLIRNTGLGPGTGAPNAWTLTARGRQTTDTIRAHTQQDSRE